MKLTCLLLFTAFAIANFVFADEKYIMTNSDFNSYLNKAVDSTLEEKDVKSLYDLLPYRVWPNAPGDIKRITFNWVLNSAATDNEIRDVLINMQPQPTELKLMRYDLKRPTPTTIASSYYFADLIVEGKKMQVLVAKVRPCMSSMNVDNCWRLTNSMTTTFSSRISSFHTIYSSLDSATHPASIPPSPVSPETNPGFPSDEPPSGQKSLSRLAAPPLNPISVKKRKVSGSAAQAEPPQSLSLVTNNDQQGISSNKELRLSSDEDTPYNMLFGADDDTGLPEDIAFGKWKNFSDFEKNVQSFLPHTHEKSDQLSTASGNHQETSTNKNLKTSSKNSGSTPQELNVTPGDHPLPPSTSQKFSMKQKKPKVAQTDVKLVDMPVLKGLFEE